MGTGDLEPLFADLPAEAGSAVEMVGSRAPASVVEAERVKQRDWTARKAQLTEKVASLCG